MADRPDPGRVRHPGVARARPGDLGGARGAAALRVIEADVLGRARPRVEARRDPRRPGAEGDLARDRRRDQGGHPGARPSRRRPAPALRDGRARRVHAAGGDLRLPSRRRRAPAPERRGDRRRPHRGRLRAALPHRRDRRRPVRQGGQLPDLLVLAGVGAGDRRRPPARPRPDGAPAQRRLTARASTPRSSTPAPAGTWATSRRRSPISRSSRRLRGSSWPSESRRSRDELLRRDRHRQRRRRRHPGAAPRAVGQAHPAPRARRLAPARAPELGCRRRVHRQPLHLRGHLVRRGHGEGLPAAGALLRRWRDQALRRGALPPARGGLRRAAPSRRRLSGVADLVRRDGALLHAGRGALPSARRTRRGPDRAAGQRALSVPGRLTRAAHPAALG